MRAGWCGVMRAGWCSPEPVGTKPHGVCSRSHVGVHSTLLPQLGDTQCSVPGMRSLLGHGGEAGRGWVYSYHWFSSTQAMHPYIHPCHTPRVDWPDARSQLYVLPAVRIRVQVRFMDIANSRSMPGRMVP